MYEEYMNELVFSKGLYISLGNGNVVSPWLDECDGLTPKQMRNLGYCIFQDWLERRKDWLDRKCNNR